MTDRSSLQRRADALLSLHTSGDLLILPNVWNPIGARVLAKKGYPAVATASAALSAALGYQDGEKITRATLVDLAGRIARSVEVPVSVDIEGGYGESLSELEATAEQVIEAGAVGVNIEDSREEGGPLRAVEDQCGRIAAVRQVAERRGIHLLINARVDSFVSSSFPDRGLATEEAVARARAYASAGADCIYPMGPGDEATVRALRGRIEAPLNILASPGAAPLSVLRSIGVNRVSFGPFVFRACLRRFERIVDALSSTGDLSFLDEMMTSEEADEYLREGREPEPRPR